MLYERFFQGRVCDSNLSYEFSPRNVLQLPLLQLGKEMESNEHSFDIRTEFVLVFIMKGVRVSLYPSGKVIVKNVSEEKKAQIVFRGVLTALNACPTARNL